MSHLHSATTRTIALHRGWNVFDDNKAEARQLLQSVVWYQNSSHPLVYTSSVANTLKQCFPKCGPPGDPSHQYITIQVKITLVSSCKEWHVALIHKRVWSIGGMILTGENHSTRRKKSFSMPLRPPQIPHGLTLDRTRSSAVSGPPLTAWAKWRRNSAWIVFKNSVRTAQ